jgi:orotate phosphoribosyltransferase
MGLNIVLISWSKNVKNADMEGYKKRLSLILAETGALFFDRDLVLKDGRPTPYFVNLGKFCTGRLLLELGSFFAEMLVSRSLVDKTDIILGPSYKGSAIASATATALFHYHGRDLLFDYDRKEAKRHGETSSSAALFVNNTFFDGCRVFVVDDVVTSMQTKYELIDKINKEAIAHGFRCETVGLGVAVDREQTAAVYDEKGNVILNRKGSNPMAEFTSKTGIPFFSVAGIREIVEYLYSNRIPLLISGGKRPMDKEIKEEFDRYVEIYGRG